MKHQNLRTAFLLILASCVIGTPPCTSLAKDKIFETPAPRPIGIVAFLEGPAWHPTGNVYVSAGGSARIMRRDRPGAPPPGCCATSRAGCSYAKDRGPTDTAG